MRDVQDCNSATWHVTHQHADEHDGGQDLHNGAGKGPPLQQPLPP